MLPKSSNPLNPRKLLAVSLTLLYVSFILFGWQWATLRNEGLGLWPFSSYPQLFWPMGIALTLSVTGLLTKPLSALRVWIKRLFESDTRMFFGVIFLTSVGVLLLVNLTVFAEALLALGVIWLARFDLRLTRIRGWQQFAIMGTVALVGFIGGGALHWSWLAHGFPWVQRQLVEWN